MKQFVFPCSILLMSFILCSSKTIAQDKSASEIPVKFIPFKPVAYQLPILENQLKADPGIPVPQNPNKNKAPEIKNNIDAQPPVQLKISTEAPPVEENKKLSSGKNYTKAATESLKIVKP